MGTRLENLLRGRSPIVPKVSAWHPWRNVKDIRDLHEKIAESREERRKLQGEYIGLKNAIWNLKCDMELKFRSNSIRGRSYKIKKVSSN